jgi:hypothetical protein
VSTIRKGYNIEVHNGINSQAALFSTSKRGVSTLEEERQEDEWKEKYVEEDKYKKRKTKKRQRKINDQIRDNDNHRSDDVGSKNL